jgi:N-methylhydantoinase A/oxoprolinase/acetone carboxylase beta subunit
LEAAVDLRYVGQQYTLTIPVAVERYRFRADAEALREAFAEEYERTYSHRLTADVEVVAVRATMRLPLPSLAQADQADPLPVVEEAPRRIDAYSLSLGKRTPFDVRHRTQLGASGSLTGPAILLEDTCTTYVDAGYMLEVGRSGVLAMRRTEV